MRIRPLKSDFTGSGLYYKHIMIFNYTHRVISDTTTLVINDTSQGYDKYIGQAALMTIVILRL